MDWKTPLLAAAMVFAAGATPSVFAQATQPAPETQPVPEDRADSTDPERANDQRIVIGAGFGSHRPATPHHAGSTVELVVNSALMTQV